MSLRAILVAAILAAGMAVAPLPVEAATSTPKAVGAKAAKKTSYLAQKRITKAEVKAIQAKTLAGAALKRGKAAIAHAEAAKAVAELAVLLKWGTGPAAAAPAKAKGAVASGQPVKK